MDHNKVLVELEWEQIDAIVKDEIRDHIITIAEEMKNDKYIHPDDKADNLELFPALCKVYKYYVGETESTKLLEELGMGYET